LASQFADTLETVALLEKLDTTKVSSTFQVTGLKNVFRKDKIDRSNLHTQQQDLEERQKILIKDNFLGSGLFFH